jgi:hypothetical protein
MPKSLQDESGTLEFRNDSVCYQRNDGRGWELPISAILVIGEMTNADGPGADDYFLCFMDHPDGWYAASFYAHGRDQLLKTLEARLNFPLTLTLCASTDLKSNVLWPPQFAGRPLFTFEPFKPKTLRDRIFRQGMCIQHLAKDVEEYLASLTSDG